MEFIMQMQPWFGEEEKQSIRDYLDENGFMTEFKRTEKFEKMIAEFTQSKHCIVVNNGTISLTLAALALDMKHGDEVGREEISEGERTLKGKKGCGGKENGTCHCGAGQIEGQFLGS